MCVGVLLSSCVVLFSCVQSSSIITKDMIRMPKKLSHLDNESHNRSLQPEQLTSTSESAQYQRIFPPHHQERNESFLLGRSLATPRNSSSFQRKISGLNSPATFENSKAQLLSSDSNQNRLENENLFKETWSSKNQENLLETNILFNSSSPTTTTSPEEMSKRYWGQYKNFSYDLFKNPDSLQSSVSDVVNNKDVQIANVWEVLQGLYDCSWSLGIFNCLQESFKAQSGSFYQFLEPQFPRLHQGDSFFQHDPDIEDSDTDEGRRKLSKKLQLILPILMMLKMTMLPALAVMALVSGKAFLLSLLSLGVAVVAASAHPAVLGASKRHEIAPQAPPPQDHLPSNYYYVM